MASHFHHLHHQSYSSPTTTTTAPCCCNSCCFYSQPHLSPPSPDPLLQALAAHILQSTPPNHHQHQHHPHHDPYSHQSMKLNPHKLHPKNQHQHHQKLLEIPDTTHYSLLSSLHQRIDALESSLHHFSISSSHYSPPHSLRDLAARVIQTHFRAFLVRRSRTLRLLKDLALIKSAFNSLKSSISSETHFDYDTLSHKAMDLLLKLDSVQGRDSMIRDGKRSISRDLVRFLEFIDGVAVKRTRLSFKAMKNMRFGHPNCNKGSVLGTKIRSLGGQREVTQNMRARAEKIGGFSRAYQNDEDDVEFEGFQQAFDDEEEEEEESPRVVISGKNGQIRNGVLVKRNGVQSRVKKSVSFAENGNVYRVFSNTHEPISRKNGSASLDESASSDDQGELDGNLCSELEEVKGFPQGAEDDDEAHLENGGSPQTSDGERNSARVIRNGGDYEIRGHFNDQNGDFVFSAPFPVKMSDGERNSARVIRNGGDYEIRGHFNDQNGDFVFSAPFPVKMEAKADQMKKKRAMKIEK